MIIYTIGHSTTEFDNFCKYLKFYKVQKVIDVRSYPGSRYVPDYNKELLEIELPKSDIEYAHFPILGGRRKSYSKDDYIKVEGWQNQSFKNYASYTLTSEYDEGIISLISEAKLKTICIMCAESVPWKCHRSIISNTLVNKDIKVVHIMDQTKTIIHKLNLYGAIATLENGKIIYPNI